MHATRVTLVHGIVRGTTIASPAPVDADYAERACAHCSWLAEGNVHDELPLDVPGLQQGVRLLHGLYR